MLGDFQSNLVEGILHILDLEGYDHALFLLVLCAAYSFRDFKKILILATAFTLGHSVTLYLGTYKTVYLAREWVEFLVGVTIVLPALWNLFFYKKTKSSSVIFAYLLAAVFGLIHGLAFSGDLQFQNIDNEPILMPLLGFNLGVEIGQIIIIAFILLLNFILVKLLKQNQFYWRIAISALGIVLGMIMIITRFPMM